MTTDASTIILAWVCPILGSMVGMYMFYAPYKDIMKAVARGSLGDLNPLPWAFMLGNCIGWVLYGALIQDLFVFVPNLGGVFFAVWYTLAASKLLYQQQFQGLPLQGEEAKKSKSTTTSVAYATPNFDYVVLGIIIVWASIMGIVSFADSLSSSTKQYIVGGACNLNLSFFYGAPLSTIATVLKTRNTASIHVLSMVMNTANSIFWACYGFAVMDYFIFVPNGLGALLGFVQVALYMVFPRRSMFDEDEEEVSTDHSQTGKDDTTTVVAPSGLTALMEGDSENPLPFKARVDADRSSHWRSTVPLPTYHPFTRPTHTKL